MVRTRHSGEIDVPESPEFMSLRNERERFTLAKRDRSADSIKLRQAYQEDDEYNIFEDKVVESRLRPRTGPRRAYNYLDVDSSDDDRGRQCKIHTSPLEIRDRFRRSREMKKEMLEDCRENARIRNSQSDGDEKHYPLRGRSSRQTESQHPVETDRFPHRTRRKESQLVDKKDEEEGDSENEGEKDEEFEEEEQKDDDDSDNEDQNEEFTDMYSRVKRKRIRLNRNMHGGAVEDRNNNNGEDSDEEEDMISIRRSERKLRNKAPEVIKSYSLREHKPRTDLYKAPVEERKIRKSAHSMFEVTPTKKTGRQPYQSPAQRKMTRKRSAMHSSSSSTSSSGSESSDEKSFRKRKAKSMAKARSRLMPMNFSNSEPHTGVIKDRVKSGASLADVEPMSIDKNINFDSIGGLGRHVRALKEMVVFPLLYDKVFQKFNVDPPRGVLFYGPPGTGKTLVARALANECSHGDKRVAFFMRKGADCLSKWVGESERQLRLLFDQAYKYRPSIIFFDEIDGLAPVRSSRQDQIHSSIVSTLLALMDGLDSRGEIVVIGATNRIDSLDPALRRPGRFDREFLFPLPTLEARKQILKIHTASWNPKLNDRFITELSEKCVGYCGADLKALCTEAAMLALRRRYPQIYLSNEALQLDESSVSICAKDFFNAVSNIIPTSRRSVNSPSRPLSVHIIPLLERQLTKAINQLGESFPPCLMKMSSLDAVATSKQAQALADSGMTLEELASDEDEDAPSIFVSATKGKPPVRKSLEPQSTSKPPSAYFNFTSYATYEPSTYRPRLLLTGCRGQGQTSYLAPAIIHKMEDLPVHVLDLPSLYAVTAKTPEESCASVFHEARRKCPSIVYMPYINQWWDVLGDTVRTTLLTLIQDLNPSTPLLLLATSEQPYSCLDPQLKLLFSEMSSEVMNMSNPTTEERRNFFKDLLLHHSCKPPTQKKTAVKRMLEALPKAAPTKPRELTSQETDALLEKEELTLMELRIFLRDVLHKLGSDKKFSIFAKPVDIENAPDYLDVIENPMDLSTMMSRIDCHEYNTVRSFMDDIDLICSNALEYNPDRGPMDKVIRHRACALKDTAYAIIRTELDKEFEKMCMEIEQSRKRRGVKSTTVPTFYRTKPVTSKDPSSSSRNATPSYLDNTRPPRSIPEPEGMRFSRRVRGLHIDPTPSLEVVERIARSSHTTSSPSKEDKTESVPPSETPNSGASASQEAHLDNICDKSNAAQEAHLDNICNKSNTANESMDAESSKEFVSRAKTDPLPKKRDRTTKCIWCKPRKRRRRFRSLINRRIIQNQRTNAIIDCDRGESSQSPPITQPLNIDTSVNSETEELKSPARKSSRISSPLSSFPGGVKTRRQSLSPRVAESLEMKTKEQLESSCSVEKTAVCKEDESSSVLIDEIVSEEPQSVAGKELIGVPELLEKTMETLQKTESEKEGKKGSVVKSLDLEFVAVDSGAGSSLDGNGDSRDSMDHKLVSIESHPPASSHPVKDINQNNRQDSSDIPNKVVVPTAKLSLLLDQLVLAVEGFNVEQLEKIYSQLSQIIYRHRYSFDRSDMVTELENKVTEMTQHSPGLASLQR